MGCKIIMGGWLKGVSNSVMGGMYCTRLWEWVIVILWDERCKIVRVGGSLLCHGRCIMYTVIGMGRSLIMERMVQGNGDRYHP